MAEIKSSKTVRGTAKRTLTNLIKDYRNTLTESSTDVSVIEGAYERVVDAWKHVQEKHNTYLNLLEDVSEEHESWLDVPQHEVYEISIARDLFLSNVKKNTSNVTSEEKKEITK